MAEVRELVWNHSWWAVELGRHLQDGAAAPALLWRLRVGTRRSFQALSLPISAWRSPEGGQPLVPSLGATAGDDAAQHKE